ncbi:MAG: hypothetical protein NTW95_10515 [Candidatus Aminicenantes bacterium]|nr:hypothetical protein [Candidatus Aminicenantes bacterium]
MDMTQFKLMIAGLGFIVIFLTGYGLRRQGQPFPVVVLTAHKLITVATIAFLAKTVLGMTKLAPLSQGQPTACIITGLLFIGAVATGGILSAAKNLPPLVRTLHWVLPFLTALSTAAALYLLLRRK